VDDRMIGGPAAHEEPLTPRQRVDHALRWLGILLPLIVTYPIVYPLVSWLGVDFNVHGLQVAVPVGAALWVGFTAALAWRRDWAGAAAVSVFYTLVDAWWWILALGIVHFD